MAPENSLTFPVLSPDLQVSFFYRLQSIRGLFLNQALRETLDRVDLRTVDGELNRIVAKAPLKKVAKFGIRGEVVFALPCVLRTNPYLLAYYRLLLGFSQKEFYTKGPFGRFKKMEDSGEITVRTDPLVPALCKSMVLSAESLVQKVDALSLDTLHELQLLTLGPQLRGGENTKLGQKATAELYDIILSTVRPYVKEATKRTIIIENESHRTVLIEFASDPDVRVVENLASGIRPLVSIEVKGGTDASNIHNRLGEAEKSHQKARGRGCFEFWTIIRVEMDPALAKRESPTTSRFFNLDQLAHATSPDGRVFREMLASIMGIRL